MRKSIFVLVLFFALGTSAYAGGQLLKVNDQDYKDLMAILLRAGTLRWTLIQGTSTGAESARCVLSTQAPAAAFLPNCTLQSKNEFSRIESLRVRPSDFQRFVQILEETGIRPEKQGNETILSTENIACHQTFNNGEGCTIVQPEAAVGGSAVAPTVSVPSAPALIPNEGSSRQVK